MDIAEHGRLLYVSLEDVSRPVGPGVNEREFMNVLLRRFGERARVLVPTPHGACTEVDDQRVTTFDAARRSNLPSYLHKLRLLEHQIDTLLRNKSFDLVVARLAPFPFALLPVLKHSVPLVIKTLGPGMKNTFSQRNTLKARAARLLSMPDELLLRLLVNNSIAVDSCTEQLMSLQKGRFGTDPEKFFLVENATNVERFSPEDAMAIKQRMGLDPNAPTIGYVGGLPAERGGRQMLDVCARLTTDFPSLTVVIVGGDEQHALYRQACQLGIEDRVLLPGVVAYENVPDYVRCFDIGFAFDRPDRLNTIGNSNQKVRQYLACGIAVVTSVESDSPLVRQRLCENVHSTDMASIEASVRKLLQRSPSAKQVHAQRARAFAEKFLSTDFALDQRLEFWNARLANGRSMNRTAA